MAYKHIVFDVDGTLINTEYAILHSLQDTINDIIGTVIEMDKLRFALGIPGEVALEKLKIPNIADAVSRWNTYMMQYMDTVKVFDGVGALLNTLSSLGHHMSIVTSKTNAEYLEEFCCFGIDHHFKTVVCADDTLAHKPSPEPLLKYIELAKAESQDILYIGDTQYDMECATRANISFALAVWGTNSPLLLDAQYI